MCILRQAFEVPCSICKIILISCDKGSIASPNKNAVNGTYAKVLPIDGIFAECSTRRPSDKKLCLGANQTSSILPSVVAAAF